MVARAQILAAQPSPAHVALLIGGQASCARFACSWEQVLVLSQLAIVLHNMATCPADVWTSPAVSSAVVALLDLLQVSECRTVPVCMQEQATARSSFF